MNITGNRIRELRLKNKLTLDDVARHLGVGRQAIYKYEQGTVTNIPLENLEKMASLFDTSPGYLAGWTDIDIVQEQRDKYDPLFKAALEEIPVPRTQEARIISGGIDKMPPERREQALRILQIAFSEYADYFKEESNNDNA